MTDEVERDVTFALLSIAVVADRDDVNMVRAELARLRSAIEASDDDDLDYSAVESQWSHQPDTKVTGVTTTTAIKSTRLHGEAWGGSIAYTLQGGGHD